MANIVNINVFLQPAPTPSTLQRTGVIISMGATNLPPITDTTVTTLGSGSSVAITQPSDLTTLMVGSDPLLVAGQTLTALTWSGGVVTGTVSGVHGYNTGDVLLLTISGSTPAAYNGTYGCTITSTTQFTYAKASNPGTATVLGTVLVEDEAEVVQAVNAYFNQATQYPTTITPVAIYILELGDIQAAVGVALLTAWLAINPQLAYIYITPNNWITNTDTLIADNSGNKDLIYFYTNCVNANLNTSAILNKSGKKAQVFAAQTVGAVGEYPAATLAAIVLNYSPSPLHKVPQAAYTYLFGWSQRAANDPNIATLTDENVNYSFTGAEGGLSLSILKMGVYQDGTQLNNWYAIDWLNVQVHQALAFAVIDGSNNTANPLFYNQQGIIRLQAVAQSVVNRAVSVGLLAGSPQVQAVSYADYIAAYPTDWENGIYNGLSVTIATNRGFLTINFTVTVTTTAP